MTAARLDALEERVAHQDAVIEDLNAVVTAQSVRIETLSRRVAALDDRMRDAEARATAAAPQAPPPHY